MMGSEPPSARDMLFIPWATLSCDSVTTFYGLGHRHTAPAPGDLGWGVEQQAAHTCASPNTHVGSHVYTRTPTTGQPQARAGPGLRAAPGNLRAPQPTSAASHAAPGPPSPSGAVGPHPLQTDPAHLGPCHAPIRPASFPLLKIAGSQGLPSSHASPRPRVMPIVGAWLLKPSYFLPSLLPAQLPSAGGNGTQRVLSQGG